VQGQLPLHQLEVVFNLACAHSPRVRGRLTDNETLVQKSSSMIFVSPRPPLAVLRPRASTALSKQCATNRAFGTTGGILDALACVMQVGEWSSASECEVQ